jgi:hypothetical protein
MKKLEEKGIVDSAGRNARRASSKELPKPTRMWMKSWTWSTTLGSPVKLRASGQWELSKVERVPLSAQLQAVHHPVERCL